ncbi:MAG: 3-deoxy-manno-octulosonate cytidylyltransferase [Candidatus Eisenbacteria bacterium]|nr:3-deoxy-manno-octulosonate cytidylyltransferase [Candidatus Eisenbacteria bacterium]
MSTERRAVAIIPARIGSTRLPRKPLQKIGGREVVLRVCDRAASSRLIDRVVVATDDEEIRALVEGAGYDARMTSPDHPTGTDRVAEAAARVDAEVIANIQGDEPFLPTEALDRAVRPMLEDPGKPMHTLVVPLEKDEEFADPNVVKVTVDREGRALYFSRSPIPHRWRGGGAPVWKHVGVYIFQREALFRFVSLPRSPLEEGEGLEQLRALENGMAIYVGFHPDPFHGIETEEDLRAAGERIAREEGRSPDRTGSARGSGS